MSLLARNTFFLTVAKFFSVSVFAVFGLVLPRFVDLAENGVYGLMMSLLFFGSMLTSFGIPLIVTRTVARDPGAAARMLADGRAAMLAGYALSAAGMILYLLFESWVLGSFDPLRFVLLACVLGIVLAEAMASLGDALFQGFERMAVPAAVEVVTGVLRAGGAVLAMVLLPPEHRLLGIFLAFLAGAALRGWFMPRLVRRRLLGERAVPPSGLRRAVALIRASGHVAVFRMLRVVRNRVDVLLLGLLFVSTVPGVTGDPDAARGVYVQAMRVALVFHTFTMAFNTALFPRFARLTEDAGEREPMRAQYARAVRWQAFWAAPLAAGLFFYAHDVAGWFGEAYVRGGAEAAGVSHSTGDVMRVLLVAVLLDCVGGPVGMLLIGVPALERRVPWIGGVIAATSVALNLALIPRFGVLGAAYACLGAAAVEFVLKTVMVRRVLGAPWRILAGAAPYLGVTAAMIGVLWAAGLAGAPLLGGLVGAAAYGAGALALRLVDPALLRAVRRRVS